MDLPSSGSVMWAGAGGGATSQAMQRSSTYQSPGALPGWRSARRATGSSSQLAATVKGVGQYLVITGLRDTKMELECTTTELHRPQPRYSASVSVQVRPRSGVRNRTRGAILAAAASVLARDRTATLSDIAEASGVGRTTLHRYFPDRESLIEAAVKDSIQAIQQSVTDAVLDQGSPLDAMRRAVA